MEKEKGKNVFVARKQVLWRRMVIWEYVESSCLLGFLLFLL